MTATLKPNNGIIFCSTCSENLIRQHIRSVRTEQYLLHPLIHGESIGVETRLDQQPLDILRAQGLRSNLLLSPLLQTLKVNKPSCFANTVLCVPRYDLP
jgi:hypothetical protein